MWLHELSTCHEINCTDVLIFKVFAVALWLFPFKCSLMNLCLRTLKSFFIFTIFATYCVKFSQSIIYNVFSFNILSRYIFLRIWFLNIASFTSDTKHKVKWHFVNLKWIRLCSHCNICVTFWFFLLVMLS